jgi:hypothetical protein
MQFLLFRVKIMPVHHGSHHLEAEMKYTLWISGALSMIAAVVLFSLGYTKINYLVGSMQVLLYPAAFFALTSLVLFFWAYKQGLKTS